MKAQILEALKKLNLEEKQDLFFEFICSKSHSLIEIKSQTFQADISDIIKAFIEMGVDVNIKDLNIKNGYGNTPLFYAKSKEIVELLIKAGADINAKNQYGETPLFFAESKEIVELLIQHGADVNIKNKFQFTFLHYSNSPEIVELMIQNGADVNAQNKHGNTPLHWSNKQAIIELLIQHGADIHIKNKNNETPSEYYRKNGNTDLADFIEQKAFEKAIKLEQEKLNQVLPQFQNNLNKTKSHL